MTTAHDDPAAPPAVRLMNHFGLDPDPWQVEVIQSPHRCQLLNCSRQAGKSTVVAALALAEAIFTGGTQVILLSRSERQSRLLFDTVVRLYRHVNCPMMDRLTRSELWLKHGSRIVSVPCREDTIRGYSNIHLLIIDEAARVPEDLFTTVLPMLAVSQGRVIALSTPAGRRGFFYQAWANGGDDWQRIEVPADRIPRIRPEFLERMRRQMGEAQYRQEFCCSFEALEGLVYPDFARCVTPGLAPTAGQLVGGVDFGFSNPWAAVWGAHDRDDVLWLFGEHYTRQKPLLYHVERMPKEVMWYCDPSGAQWQAELTLAGRKVQPGINDVMAGIAAVTARLESGRLKVVAGTCPNLLHEAALYRYEEGVGGRRTEAPVREYNHALDALRYLVSRLDEGRQGRPRRPAPPGDVGPTVSARPRPVFRSWHDLIRDPDVWTPL